MTIWQKLKEKLGDRPILALAPMADVTDSPFRQIVADCGKPDIFYTEFISADGLCSAGKEKLVQHLKFSKKERPLIVQFFGSSPENFYKCAKLAQEYGFDGIDINMGCPQRNIEKSGSGAALLKNIPLAVEIVKATIRGAGKLPVSIKTRLGYSRKDILEWLPQFMGLGLSAVVIHGRTRKELSNAPVDWKLIGKAGEIVRRDGALIIGNGDIVSIQDAKLKAESYNLDGIMIGRGIFENLWLFSEVEPRKTRINPAEISSKIKMELLKKHTKLFIKFWGQSRNFNNLKKFYKIYISGPRFAVGSGEASWEGAKKLRIRLMETKSAKEVSKIVDNYKA